MADVPPETGRFYRFIHHSTERFPFLPILRVHRHSLPPEGQDPPPLADLHPGDVVEVSPVRILGPGDVHPETGAPITEATEFPVAVNHPHLEPILSEDATETNIGAALVQDPSVPESMAAPTPAPVDATPPAEVTPLPEPIATLTPAPVETIPAPETPAESAPTP